MMASKTKKYSLFFAIRELASDRKLSALFATDFILFLGYFCLACIRTYSTLLRSDTNYYCSTGILQFIFFAHNCLMIIASIHYKAVLLRIVNKRKTKKTPKSMAPDIKDIASITASEMPTKKETFAVTVVEQHQVVDKKDSTVPRSVQTQETQ
ncbi:hypothetical protein HK103_007085 [Boothiomyces macroporosus]|uniref:Uncharacterized protein n=1 Tax=Boothiomyces macroporosus TaxID=261099 RepID=A0AAD5Y683_9FUNG|nr:hypothetical protein HK103_007085 [Boothiomyces macroporosus]